ncbi:MAG: ferrous iron transport protein A, partial [Thermoleophilia bacterium]|nr:ferrous iron transport protein A [Thermoleophilia bacterium]
LRENPTLKPLSKLDEGTEATIVRLAEHDGDLLHFFYDADLLPGVEIQVVAVSADGAAVTIRRGEDQLVLTREQARGLYGRPAGVPVVPADTECWGSRGLGATKLAVVGD